MPSRKLNTYRAKRDFTKTAEPSGAKTRMKTGNAYLIQKHAASRLHYDFRLELDGTLKSWAVTKGPSLDPADKRLAVHVEDHPLDYGGFEGIIPQGQYGGGTVMLWDTGRWEPVGDPHQGYKKGRLDFILHGKRLKGEWHLVRMTGRAAQHGKNENWLLIKSHDDFAEPGHGEEAIERYQKSAVSNRSMERIAEEGGQPIKEGKTKPRKAAARPAPVKKKPARNEKPKPPPDFVAPQLATLVKQPPQGKNWVHEIKFDGYRALCRIDGGDVKLITRADNDWTDRFYGLADELRQLPVDNALIDGEVVSLKPDGTMSFGALQHALGKGGRRDKLHYYAFDLLYLNGEDYTSKPLTERKKALLEIWPRTHPHMHYSESFTESGEQVLGHACRIALEGIVSKRAEAPYRGGRGDAWLKAKCVNEQEAVIGGYTEQPKHPGALGAMLLGYYEGNDLVFAGKVGTGFSHEDGRKLLAKFKPLRRAKSPFKNPPRERNLLWLEPKLVAQVFFTEWTEGGAMRHPSFQGLREDKPAKQVVREKPADNPLSAEETAPMTKPLPKSAKSKNAKSDSQIAGVTLTHPDKILYTGQNITKRELAEYYDAAAPYILPHLADRPISLVRCPSGSGKTCFFQRHIAEGRPPHVGIVPVTINEKRNYLTIHDKAGLIELVQMGVLEIHMWGAHAENVGKPDRMVFDLDPAENVPWEKVKRAALELRKHLKLLKLESFLEVTGGKGFHVVVPLAPAADWNEFKNFSRAVADAMAQAEPELYTINSRKEQRKGRIYIDYLRNAKGSSAIAPYSTRAHEGAPVAVPLAWEELKGLKSARAFNMRNVLPRLRKMKKDPWAGMEKLKQRLPPLKPGR